MIRSSALALALAYLCIGACSTRVSSHSGGSVADDEADFNDVNVTRECPGSKRQMCKMLCPIVRCPKASCLMRTDNCCETHCASVVTDECEGPMQLQCRRMCPPLLCPLKGGPFCLMRTDNCCETHCASEVTDECKGSMQQQCK